MLGMGNMRQWLMNISLVGGWFPAAAFAVIAVLSVTLLVSAAVSKRDGRILATVLPIGVAAVSGMVGYVVAWLLSDVFVVFGVGLGSRVMSWVAAGFAIAGFAIVHIVLSRGMMRVAAAILTVFAILAAAIGIDQSYGEYATIGSLFGEDSYSQADLTGLAKRKDLITVAQWRKQAANGTIRNIPANGTVNKIDIPATKSQFEARKALVYLPPAALADSKRKPALPVVLMLSGQPGSPGRVFQAGGIQTMMDGYAKTHDGLAPIVIAADQLGADSHNTLPDAGRGRLGENQPARRTGCQGLGHRRILARRHMFAADRREPSRPVWHHDSHRQRNQTDQRQPTGNDRPVLRRRHHSL